MQNEYEHGEPTLNWNPTIARELAKTHGEYISNKLRSMLAGTALATDLSALKDRYEIPSMDIDDLYCDEYIATAVFKKLHGNMQFKADPEKNDYFVQSIGIFSRELKDILDKHEVNESWMRIIMLYIAKGRVDPMDSVNGVVRASLNLRTRELTITIKPEVRDADAKRILPLILKRAERFRPHPHRKRQTSYGSKRMAEVMEYEQKNGYKAAVEEYAGPNEEQRDSIAKAITRSKDKRKNIKSRTPFA